MPLTFIQDHRGMTKKDISVLISLLVYIVVSELDLQDHRGMTKKDISVLTSLQVYIIASELDLHTKTQGTTKPVLLCYFVILFIYRDEI